MEGRICECRYVGTTSVSLVRTRESCLRGHGDDHYMRSMRSMRSMRFMCSMRSMRSVRYTRSIRDVRDLRGHVDDRLESL